MSDDDAPGARPPPRFRSLTLPQREIALLAFLALLSVALFLTTRQLAAWTSSRRAEAGRYWYARSTALSGGGDRDAVIAALREAVGADRSNAQYRLALAAALADGDRDLEAQQVLLQLRQTEPDDVEVNYRLARVMARRGADPQEAIRYYNHAIYGLVRIGTDYDRRQIRSELIEFLLDRGLSQEAIAELEALDRELPETADAHVDAARLADRANAPAPMLEFARHAARIAPSNPQAALYAGLASAALGDFGASVKELERAERLNVSPSDRLRNTLALGRQVLSNDPFAPRLAASERARRVRVGLARVAELARACDPTTPEAELDQWLKPGAVRSDLDKLTEAVAVIGRAQTSVRARCPTRFEAVDEAWAVIVARQERGTR